MNGLTARRAGSPEPVHIHRAPWVFPGIGPAIADGAVAVCGDHIVEVGKARDVVSRYGTGGARLWDHEASALVPAAINAHTHLDFSGLSLSKPEEPPGFARWVFSVFEAKGGLSPSERREARSKGRAEAAETGTVWLGDVVNPPLDGVAHDRSLPFERRFVEVLGFSARTLEEVLPALPGGETMPWPLAAHSLYGTSWDVIRQAKAWTRAHRLPFSIHAAEHREETAFVRDGEGFCRDLLTVLGRWNAAWRPSGTSPVRTLEALGVLDPQTLLVHMVHVDPEDWDITARRGACVCFCPRSNLWIEGTLPKIEEAIRRKIPCALGTDSRASNEDLNLFREGAAVLDAYPGVEPAVVLRMMTLGGARALGLEGSWGVLAPGAAMPFLAVPLGGCPASENDLAEAIIRQGSMGRGAWIGGETSC
uniref:Amidohydrolase-related domain-containing protein n=1 Tax=Desulfacinum infernum TaxID=35837 RepID=A0A832E9L5_9BACT